MDGDAAFPQARSLPELREEAIGAMKGRDFVRAVACWQALRQLQPADPAGYSGGVGALQSLQRYEEASTLMAEALARFPSHPGLLATAGTLHSAKGEWPQAERAWTELAKGDPGHVVKAAIGQATARAAQGKVQEAEASLFTLCKQNPGNIELLTAQADIAARARNWALAEQRWRALYERVSSRSVHGLADALIQQRSFDEAAALLDASLIVMPDSRPLLEVRARVAAGRADWDDAEHRWLAITERFPDSFAAWHGVAHARQRRGDPQGAERAATAGVERFPSHPVLLSIHASVATDRGDWPEAERRWNTLRTVAPNYVNAWFQQARAQRALGRLPEAAALLTQATMRFPADTGIATQLAEIETELEHWPQAYDVLARLQQIVPNDKGIQQRSFEARWRMSGAAEPQQAKLALQAPVAVREDDDCRLMSRFESLGDNAEFAAVQRYFGAEPATLFRWSDISTPNLTSLLNDGLESLDDPANMRLTLAGDYKIRDRRFNFTFHTFIKEEQADLAAFLAMQCKRTQLLRRKILSELQAGEKIFVYKSSKSDPMQQVQRLHRAIRKHGNGNVLYVRLADSQHPGGTVEQVAPGLIVGYLSSIYDGVTTPSIAFEAWVNICRQTLSLIDPQGGAATVKLGDLMLRFENLGNSCEFGLVQRYGGVEPMGLLRWTATTLPELTTAVENGFEGFGDVANSELLLADDYRAVYAGQGLTMRSFARGDRTDKTRLAEEQCRRMKGLRDAFLTSLGSPDTIFLHKAASAPPMEEVAALQQAVARRGPATLFHVRPADSANPPGSIRAVGPRFCVGYMDKLVAVSGGAGVQYQSWRDLCRAFYA